MLPKDDLKSFKDSGLSREEDCDLCLNRARKLADNMLTRILASKVVDGGTGYGLGSYWSVH